MVDLEALERDAAFNNWAEIHELIAEVRELRAERDALNESAEALSARWDGLVAERDALKEAHERNAGALRDVTRERGALSTRVAELTAERDALKTQLSRVIKPDEDQKFWDAMRAQNDALRARVAELERLYRPPCECSGWPDGHHPECPERKAVRG